MMMNQGKFWIYKPGHSDFINCTYALGSGDSLRFPPEAEGAKFSYQDDWQTGSASSLYLKLNRTFEGFKKLCFEAKVLEEKGTVRNPDGIGIADSSAAFAKLTTEKAYYEINLADFQNEDRIKIYLHSGNTAFIYKMWAE
jgi:hypothetical protein